MYVDGFKTLMGKYQEELADSMPVVLEDGRLHLYNMFAFKKRNRVPWPGTILHLLEKIESPNKAKFALGGFNVFLDSVYVYLSKPEGRLIFMEKSARELENFPTLEYDYDYQEHVTGLVDSARDKLAKLKLAIKNGKPYGQFQQEVLGNAEDKRQFMEKMQGEQTTLAAEAVPKYMESEFTKRLYKRLEELAMNPEEEITREVMVWLGHELAKRWHIKQGHRPQWIKVFTFEKWIELLETGDKAYPWIQVEKDKLNNSAKSRVNSWGEQAIYTRGRTRRDLLKTFQMVLTPCMMIMGSGGSL